MNREEARKKAEALVAKMTVEEKAGQLKFDAPSIERLGIPAYNWWNEALHGVARAGTATVFPQGTGIFTKALRSGLPMSIFSGILDGEEDMKLMERILI